MARQIRRVRLLVIVVSILVFVVAAVFTLFAQDVGSAAIAVLAIVVSLLTFFGDSFKDAFRSRRRAYADIRAALLSEGQSEWDMLRRTLPPAEAQIQLSALPVGRAGATIIPVDQPLSLFRSADNRLAITGAPGSGKTTTAVRLFGELLAESGNNGQEGIPVFLRLATWDGQRPQLTKWLADQIADRFALSAADAETAVGLVVPFLDGLDEVSEANRKECARSIEQYLQTMRNAPMVVCCRVDEFANLSLSHAGSSLLPVRLAKLSPTELQGFFTGLDEQVWAPLNAELTRRPDGPLARVLASPLMASLVQDVWGRRNSAELLRLTSARDLDEPQTRATLWDYWMSRAARMLTEAEKAGAIGIAVGLTEAGTSEIQIHRLGRPWMRWAWYLTKAVVVGALACFTSPVFAVFAFAANLFPAIVRATGRLPLRIALILRQSAMWLLIAVVLVLVFRFFDPAPVVAIGLALGSAVLAAWPKEEIEPLSAAMRNAGGDAFRALRRAVVAPVLVLVGISLLLAVVYSFLAGGRHPPWLLAAAALIAIYAASFAGLDFAGYHLVARTWYRIVRGVHLKSLMTALVDKGIVQRTGHSYRFFHVELQRYLSTQHSATTVAFDNVGMVGFLEAAMHAANEGDFAKAVDLVRRVTRVLPNVDLSLSLGIYLALMGSDDDALTALNEAAQRSPTDPAGAQYRGAVLQRLGRLDDALEAYDQALAIDPEHADSHFGRAAVLSALGRLDEALAAYDEVVALVPDAAEVHGDRGELLDQLGRSADAVAAFDRAIALDPDRGWFHIARASALTALDRGDEALAALDRAEERVPEQPLTAAERGRALVTLRRYSEALDAYDRALALDRDASLNRARIHLDRANVLSSLDRPADALAAIDEVVTLAPDAAEVHGDRGELLDRLGRFVDAVAAYDHAIALDPDLGWLHLGRAHALQSLGRYQDALDALDHAGTLDPDNSNIDGLRADALRDLERPDEALAAVDTALRRDPEQPWLHVLRATILATLHRLDDAFLALDHAESLESANPVVGLGRAEVLRKAERFEEALPVLDTVIETVGREAPLLTMRGQILLDMGRTEEAVAALEESQRLSPQLAQTATELQRVRAGVRD
jgi:tetratricopeptide (TPR) repeat protein